MPEFVDEFINGPLIGISLWVFGLGLAVRFAIQAVAVVRSSLARRAGGRPVSAGGNLLGLAAPLHRLMATRPVYALGRAVFHVGLAAVPVFLAGHISLWEDSDLEWNWWAMPDEWADWITLAIIAAAGGFIIRRLVRSELRRTSGPTNWWLLVITLATFASGYLLTHGTLDDIAPALGEQIMTIHLLCGELMLISAVFLFWRVVHIPGKCVGCAACVENCPTGTLTFADVDGTRIFNHTVTRCLACGRCHAACPETALTLAHDLRLAHLVSAFRGAVVNRMPLRECVQCGQLYMPDSQADKAIATLDAAGHDSEHLCTCARCRKINSRAPNARRRASLTES